MPKLLTSLWQKFDVENETNAVPYLIAGVYFVRFRLQHISYYSSKPFHDLPQSHWMF